MRRFLSKVLSGSHLKVKTIVTVFWVVNNWHCIEAAIGDYKGQIKVHMILSFTQLYLLGCIIWDLQDARMLYQNSILMSECTTNFVPANVKKKPDS